MLMFPSAAVTVMPSGAVVSESVPVHVIVALPVYVYVMLEMLSVLVIVCAFVDAALVKVTFAAIGVVASVATA